MRKKTIDEMGKSRTNEVPHDWNKTLGHSPWRKLGDVIVLNEAMAILSELHKEHCNKNFAKHPFAKLHFNAPFTEELKSVLGCDTELN